MVRGGVFYPSPRGVYATCSSAYALRMQIRTFECDGCQVRAEAEYPEKGSTPRGWYEIHVRLGARVRDATLCVRCSGRAADALNRIHLLDVRPRTRQETTALTSVGGVIPENES